MFRISPQRAKRSQRKHEPEPEAEDLVHRKPIASMFSVYSVVNKIPVPNIKPFVLFVSFVVTLTLVFGTTALTQDKKPTAAITIGYSAISGSFAPLWVAQDQGLFARQGIDTKLAYIQGNRVMLAALTTGE